MKVQMINSVGEYVAGTEVDVPDEMGDRFIVLGYAEGELTRDYNEQEQQLLRADNQEVSI